MATKTRAVAVVNARGGTTVIRNPVRRGHRTGLQLPLAVVAGFVPVIWDVYNWGRYYGAHGAAQVFVKDMTGYDIDSRKWNAGDMFKGWAPILGGIAVHYLGNRLGVNRALSRAGIPFIRL